jgi:2',3'-cyclic-nucleotide 2'-phosphodiesterase (5'-nucleotidase family)
MNLKLRNTMIILVIICMVGLSPQAAGAAPPPRVTYSLTVLHNNDGESQLINAPGQPDFGGVARFKTLVDKLKGEATPTPPSRPGVKQGVIMLSSGDNFLAGPRFNASLEKGFPFYDTIAMSLIGYDAAAIGNHEFDFGPEVLADFIGGFGGRLPFVSANLDFSAEPSLQALVDQKVIVKSHVIRESRGTDRHRRRHDAAAAGHLQPAQRGRRPGRRRGHPGRDRPADRQPGEDHHRHQPPAKRQRRPGAGAHAEGGRHHDRRRRG